MKIFHAAAAAVFLFAAAGSEGKENLSKDSNKAVMFVDRATGELTREAVMGDAALRFAYETLLGRTLWGVLFNTSLLSDLMGAYYDSALSRKSIRKLTALPGCAAAEREHNTLTKYTLKMILQFMWVMKWWILR